MDYLDVKKTNNKCIVLTATPSPVYEFGLLRFTQKPQLARNNG